MALALLAVAVLDGCSQDGSSGRYDPKLGVSASERVVTGGPVPKGGGHYKLGTPYAVAGRWYVPREEPGYDHTGVASWYGEDFHGRRTANGELFDRGALTAAHPTLPLPSYAYVTNLDNGRTVLVRVNDRGPYARDRILDLSHAGPRRWVSPPRVQPACACATPAGHRSMVTTSTSVAGWPRSPGRAGRAAMR